MCYPIPECRGAASTSDRPRKAYTHQRLRLERSRGERNYSRLLDYLLSFVSVDLPVWKLADPQELCKLAQRWDKVHRVVLFKEDEINPLDIADCFPVPKDGLPFPLQGAFEGRLFRGWNAWETRFCDSDQLHLCWPGLGMGDLNAVDLAEEMHVGVLQDSRFRCMLHAQSKETRSSGLQTSGFGMSRKDSPHRME